MKILLQSIFYSFGLSLILILLGDGYEDVYYWAYGLFIVTLAGFLISFQFFTLNAQNVLDFINSNEPLVQSSTGLITKKNKSLVEEIQLERIKKYVIEALKKLSPPISLFNTFLFALFTLIAWYLVNQAKMENDRVLGITPGSVTNDSLNQANENLKIAFGIDKASMRVIPPSYTGKRSFYSDLESISIPERSTLIINIESKPERNLFVIENLNDTINFNENEKGKYFYRSENVTSDKIVEIGVLTEGEFLSVTSFSINVIPDNAPEITFIKPVEEYLITPFKSDFKFDIITMVKDDYAITDVKIVTTVSRGSGESVKFRDQEFDMVRVGNGRYAFSLTTNSLSLEPGDEVYFHVRATDNKEPAANITKSQTRFIKLVDENADKLTYSGGMAVDIMPEYFRSQRQIIIDTKKLISDSLKITKDEFRQRSNELGYDQKLLRIRYSKFMGEEFETGGLGITTPEADATEEHDHGGDGDDHEDHEHESDAPSATGKDELTGLDDFVHTHDIESESTFFDQSIKALLRAALNEMWDAELYLRMMKPSTALPYEERALLLIKEIQQRSRVYVERVGFEPPPIKLSERRYAGDLNDISDKRISEKAKIEEYNLYTSLISFKDYLIGNSKIYNSADIQLVGNEFSRRILQNNDITLLKPLASLRKVSQGDKLSKSESDQLLQSLNKILSDFNYKSENQKVISDSLVNFYKKKLTQ
ncbi:DUF4175 family protein [Marinigracilibium pacificum]|uniref:DUF4175 domain-containing protein n=1 Tax=Marinigracilibium pacificum TaxID=2729599 RepID=A0A848J1S7_9BACT|nr:DUF4175 family protein [Marinigracilibium pacificum]NMM48424.1 DUF4175 domain-containing protein [Marinigracilibium pacificum]